MACQELKFLHCGMCEDSRPHGESMREYARLSVAVTPEGDLLVECVRHNAGVAYLKNQDVARILGEVGLQPCGCADHKDKETVH